MAAIIHISEAEAARDFAAVIRRVRAGHDVVVDDEEGPSVVIRAAVLNGSSSANDRRTPRGKTAEQIIQAFARWEAENGPLDLDEDFVKDMEAIHLEYNRPTEDRWG